MINTELRQFRNELVAMINERQFPIEVKSLIINDIARDVAAQSDKTIVYEQLTQQEKAESVEKEATENVDRL